MARGRTTGYALVLVLWVLVLLTTMAMAFTAGVRTDTRAALSLAEQVRLRAAADAAIARSIDRLSESNAAEAVAAGTTYEMPWPDANLRVTMASESAKLDINYAPRPLLIGLFETVLPEASAEALADAVQDWRDRDERRSAQGAEAADYRAAGRRQLPTNRPFRSTAELAQVMGFDADRVERLRPHITVFARRPRIDPFSADATVLSAAPGLDLELAQQFVAYREAQRASGEAVQLDMLGRAGRYLERRPTLSAVNIQAVARNRDGRALSRVAVVRPRGRAGYQLLDWRRAPVPISQEQP
jgi:general secretion pathway protein K